MKVTEPNSDRATKPEPAGAPRIRPIASTKYSRTDGADPSVCLNRPATANKARPLVITWVEPKTGARPPYEIANKARPLVTTALACILLLSWSRPSTAGDPRLKWRTITTRHFYIHYYEREKVVARRLALVAEGVHAVLSPALRWKPRRRVHIVVSDDTDSANGFSSVIPRNEIHIFATAPGGFETLNDFDDWLTLLFTHEYTHTLHLSTQSGISKLINWIFGFGRGRLYTPNLVQPRWFIEGIAVLDETIRTSAGRIRSALFRMMIRAVLLDRKAFFPIDELSSSTLRYPHGRAAYLYGAFFIHYLFQKFGWKALVGVSHEYGGQFIPFGINKVARHYFGGKGYIRLYREWAASLKREAMLSRERVLKRGIIEGRRLTHSGEATCCPRFSPDGRRIAFVEDDGHSERALKTYNLSCGAIAVLTRIETGGSACWSPDGKRFYISQLENYRAVYSYGDLFTWSAGQRRIRMSKGLRASSVDLSPDGRRLAFVRNRNGRRCLYTARLLGPSRIAQPKRRWCGPGRFDQAYEPRFSPDGRKIIFSAWLQGGFRDLFLLNLDRNEVDRLTEDRALDTSPVFAPDGRRVYFSSDRTGIFNIYALDLSTKKLFQVTNVVTGAFQPDVSPDGKKLAYVGFTAKGFDLYLMDLRRSRWLAALPFVRVRPETGQSNRAVAALAHRKVILSDKAYNPLWTLPPETWWASWDGANQNLILQLSGQDAVGYHSWSLAASYAFANGNWSLSGAYNYSRLYTPMHLGWSHGEWLATDWQVAGRIRPYRATSTRVNLGMDMPVLRSFRYGSLTLKGRYQYQHRACRDCPDTLVTPQDPLPAPAEMPQSSGLGISLEYVKIRAYAYSVSPEKGTILAVTAKAATPALGADYTTSTLTWHWTQYLPIPWMRHHVLVSRYTGGIGWGDPAQRTLFGLGGFGGQDYLDAIVNGTVVYGSSLRGYAPNTTVGDHYHLLNLEYRMPLFWLNRGLWTIPFLMKRVWGTVFSDWGLAYFGNPGWKILRDFRLGVGAELLLELVLGYELPMTLRIGYAYGVDQGGGQRYYIFFGAPLN